MLRLGHPAINVTTASASSLKLLTFKTLLHNGAYLGMSLSLCHVQSGWNVDDYVLVTFSYFSRSSKLRTLKLFYRCKQGIYSRFEFVDVKRLSEVIVCAGVHGSHFTVYIGERSNDDDRGAHKDGLCP